MAKTSPTQRSLKHLREAGFTCGIVEKWNRFAGIRQDLYGWIDILACAPGMGIVGIQTTTKANMNARVEKARGNGQLVAFLLSGGHLECHGWAKRKGHWICDVKKMAISDCVDQSTLAVNEA